MKEIKYSRRNVRRFWSRLPQTLRTRHSVSRQVSGMRHSTKHGHKSSAFFSPTSSNLSKVSSYSVKQSKQMRLFFSKEVHSWWYHTMMLLIMLTHTDLRRFLTSLSNSSSVVSRLHTNSNQWWFVTRNSQVSSMNSQQVLTSWSSVATLILNKKLLLWILRHPKTTLNQSCKVSNECYELNFISNCSKLNENIHTCFPFILIY